MAKVSGAKKALIKKIIWIKNKNLPAEEELAEFDALRIKHPVNYFECMNKSLKDPWSRLLK
jgi:hypothetical protein